MSEDESDEFVMTCDDCGEPGSTEAPESWLMDPETQRVYCLSCAKKRGLEASTT